MLCHEQDILDLVKLAATPPIPEIVLVFYVVWFFQVSLVSLHSTFNRCCRCVSSHVYVERRRSQQYLLTNRVEFCPKAVHRFHPRQFLQVELLSDCHLVYSIWSSRICTSLTWER